VALTIEEGMLHAWRVGVQGAQLVGTAQAGEVLDGRWGRRTGRAREEPGGLSCARVCPRHLRCEPAVPLVV